MYPTPTAAPVAAADCPTRFSVSSVGFGSSAGTLVAQSQASAAGGRVRKGDGQMPPSQEDLNFYTHELDEFQRYNNLGFETGLPDDPHA